MRNSSLYRCIIYCTWKKLYSLFFEIQSTEFGVYSENLHLFNRVRCGRSCQSFHSEGVHIEECIQRSSSPCFICDSYLVCQYWGYKATTHSLMLIHHLPDILQQQLIQIITHYRKTLNHQNPKSQTSNPKN